MKDKKKDAPKSPRSPYSDFGLMIAVAIFVIMLIRTLVFEPTVLTVAWGCLALAYLCISVANNSYSRVVRISTTVMLLFSVLLAAGSVFFDRPARPKMVAFQGAAVDTVAEEPEVEEEPEIKPDTIVSVDSLDMTALDSVSVQEPVSDHASDSTNNEPAL